MEIQSDKDSVGSQLNEDASEKEWTNLIIHKNSEILSRWIFRKFRHWIPEDENGHCNNGFLEEEKCLFI